MACQTQFLCTGLRSSIYHARYKDVNRNYTARSSFKCPPASAMAPLPWPLTRHTGTARHRGVQSPRTCARLARLPAWRSLSIETWPLENFVWFAPCSLLTEHFSNILEKQSQIVAILSYFCLLCFPACLVFACFLTKRKTSLPYDKTSLPHILLIFTPHCSLAVPPKGGTGLVVRS